MNKFETEQALMRLGEQMAVWRKARTASLKARDRVLRLLLHHAAVNRMTVSEVAKHTGFTRKQIRAYMAKFNLDWHQPKTLLAERAGKALRQNAEIMGLTPAEMDLTSPLAYLPMGDKMVREFLETQVAPVDPNVTTEMDHECPHCGHTFTETL